MPHPPIQPLQVFAIYDSANPHRHPNQLRGCNPSVKPQPPLESRRHLAEVAEVVFSHQIGCRLPHPLHIQRRPRLLLLLLGLPGLLLLLGAACCGLRLCRARRCASWLVDCNKVLVLAVLS